LIDPRRKTESRKSGDMERSLSVSIVNTRELEMLQPCLTSLFEHPYTQGPFEVIVLNNAAPSGSAKPIKEQFQGVRVLEESLWRGFGANHNYVARMANGDLLFILNPDAVVHEGALDRLAGALAHDPTTAVAAGPILNPDGSRWASSPFPFPSPLRSLAQAIGIHRLSGSATGPSTQHTYTKRWVSGSAFMVDRSAFISFGGFDERFFIYAEEIDLMLRMTRSGRRIVWVPDAHVTHVGRSSATEAVNGTDSASTHLRDYELRRINQYVRSKVAYMEKHRGRPGALAYRLAMGFNASLRLALSSVPPLRGLLEARGRHPGVTRHHHLTRLRAAMDPRRGPFISDLADEWNERIANSGAGSGR